jgi:hypothetical protein
MNLQEKSRFVAFTISLHFNRLVSRFSGPHLRSMAWRLIRAVRQDDSVFRPSSPSKLQLHEGTKGRRGRGGGSMRSWWLWKVNGAAQEQYSTGNIGGNCFPPGLLPSTSQVHTMYILVKHFSRKFPADSLGSTCTPDRQTRVPV